MAVISNGIGPEDLIRIEEILRSTSFFYDFEIDTALVIVEKGGVGSIASSRDAH